MKLKYMMFVSILALSFALAACDKEGPAEKAGEKIDETIEKAGEKAEEAGDKIKESTQ